MTMFIYWIVAIVVLRLITVLFMMNPLLGIAVLAAGFFYIRSKREEMIRNTKTNFFNQQGAYYNANQAYSTDDEYDSSYAYDDSFRESNNYDDSYDSAFSSNTGNSKDVFEAEYTEKDVH